jgi:nucleoside-diphosphate-sugar epimerase
MSPRDSTPGTGQSVFIFGMGYVGGYLVDELLSRGWEVSGTCTNIKKIEEYRKKGVAAFLFDGCSGPMFEPGSIETLRSASHILSTIPPESNSESDLVLKHHAIDVKQSVLSGSAKWIGYLSSTGVYGDCGGGWVNEDSPMRPDNPKTLARAKSETSWWYLNQ